MGRTDQVDAVLAAMSLEHKVGQLFVPYVTGGSADTAAAENRARFGVGTPAEAVARYHPGGVIYYAWSGNTCSPGQIAEFGNGLQRANAAAGNPVPLSIATDQETGSVARIGPPATVLIDSMALGAARDPRLTHDAYQITGRELRALGITADYAPDADVNVNPANPVIGIRSFSSDPSVVAAHVSAAVRGLQDAGVSATAKHFPGHGDTNADSHTSLPVITHSRRQWETIDAPPFLAAIEAGVDAIMSAHLSFPALDPSGDPATFSHTVLTGLLRTDLGFDGVIATDSLRMAGVRLLGSDEQIAIRALEAGADVLLDPQRPAAQFRAVVDAVRTGRLSEQRIEESVRRILLMKARRGVLDHPVVDTSLVASIVGNRGHRDRARAIGDRTTTLVIDDAGLVPLPAHRRTLVTGWGDSQVPQIATGLRQRGWAVDVLLTGASPSSAAISTAVRWARIADQVVITTSDVRQDSGQQRLVAALVETTKPVLVLALGNPSDFAYLPGVRSYLAACSATSVAVEAGLRVIAGQTAAQGRLPVDIIDPITGAVLVGFGAGLAKGLAAEQ